MVSKAWSSYIWTPLVGILDGLLVSATHSNLDPSARVGKALAEPIYRKWNRSSADREGSTRFTSRIACQRG